MMFYCCTSLVIEPLRIYTVSQKSSPFLFLRLPGEMLTNFHNMGNTAAAKENLQPDNIIPFL